MKFMEGPTYISSDIVSQKDAAFPAVTVCPISNGYKEDVLKAHGIEKVDDYNYHKSETWSWSSNQTDVTEVELFYLATTRLDELVKKFFIRFFKADVSQHLIRYG